VAAGRLGGVRRGGGGGERPAAGGREAGGAVGGGGRTRGGGGRVRGGAGGARRGGGRTGGGGGRGGGRGGGGGGGPGGSRPAGIHLGADRKQGQTSNGRRATSRTVSNSASTHMACHRTGSTTLERWLKHSAAGAGTSARKRGFGQGREAACRCVLGGDRAPIPGGTIPRAVERRCRQLRKYQFAGLLRRQEGQRGRLPRGVWPLKGRGQRPRIGWERPWVSLGTITATRAPTATTTGLLQTASEQLPVFHHQSHHPAQEGDSYLSTSPGRRR